MVRLEVIIVIIVIKDRFLHLCSLSSPDCPFVSPAVFFPTECFTHIPAYLSHYFELKHIVVALRMTAHAIPESQVRVLSN